MHRARELLSSWQICMQQEPPVSMVDKREETEAELACATCRLKDLRLSTDQDEPGHGYLGRFVRGGNLVTVSEVPGASMCSQPTSSQGRPEGMAGNERRMEKGSSHISRELPQQKYGMSVGDGSFFSRDHWAASKPTESHQRPMPFVLRRQGPRP